MHCSQELSSVVWILRLRELEALGGDTSSPEE
jgi:hypothetical protein